LPLVEYNQTCGRNQPQKAAAASFSLSL
jgi:hypothetical protein